MSVHSNYVMGNQVTTLTCMGKDANGTLPMRVNMVPIRVYEKKTINNTKSTKGTISKSFVDTLSRATHCIST